MNEDDFVTLLIGAPTALRLYVPSLLRGDGAAPEVAQQANTTG